MLRKLWGKCVNYETVSYIICGFLTTAVDFAVYALLRQIEIGVGLSQAMSWLAAVLFAYVVNKLIVFRNYNLRPSYLVRRWEHLWRPGRSQEPLPGCSWWSW